MSFPSRTLGITLTLDTILSLNNWYPYFLCLCAFDCFLPSCLFLDVSPIKWWSRSSCVKGGIFWRPLVHFVLKVSGFCSIFLVGNRPKFTTKLNSNDKEMYIKAHKRVKLSFQTNEATIQQRIVLESTF